MGCSGQEVLGPPFLYAPEKYAVSFIWKVNGTIIPLVLSSPLFWFVMLAHGAFLLCFRYFDEPYLPWKAALVPSSLLTFLLVTFVNQCFERYFTLYRFCVGLHGSVMEWSALVKLEFGHMSSNYKWNVLRLLLGALQVHYALLGGDSVTDEDGFVIKGISDDEWRAIRTRNLLSRDEIARLRAFAGFKPFLPVGWALAEVKAGLLGVDAAAAVGTSLGKDLAAREVFSAFREVAFKFRTESSSTFALLNAPVPFAYFHVLKLLMVLSLLIISYALIDLLAGEALLSYIVFGLSSLVMIGLSELAIAMSDPFGDDQADFNLEAFLESVYDNAVGFLTEDRSLRHSGLPVEMHNPLDEPWLRRWSNDPSIGLFDRRATPSGTPRMDNAEENATASHDDTLPPPHLDAPSAACLPAAAAPAADGESHAYSSVTATAPTAADTSTSGDRPSSTGWALSAPKDLPSSSPFATGGGVGGDGGGGHGHGHSAAGPGASPARRKPIGGVNGGGQNTRKGGNCNSPSQRKVAARGARPPGHTLV